MYIGQGPFDRKLYPFSMNVVLRAFLKFPLQNFLWGNKKFKDQKIQKTRGEKETSFKSNAFKTVSPRINRKRTLMPPPLSWFKTAVKGHWSEHKWIGYWRVFSLLSIRILIISVLNIWYFCKFVHENFLTCFFLSFAFLTMYLLFSLVAKFIPTNKQRKIQSLIKYLEKTFYLCWSVIHVAVVCSLQCIVNYDF